MPGLVPARAVCAVLFSAYALALPPHLVHHLPEDQPDCQYVVLSQQSPELQPEPPTLVSPGVIVAVEIPPVRFGPPSLDVAARQPRAPPSPIPAPSFA